MVIDCYTREFLGRHPSRSGKATMAASALEQALINRFGTSGKVKREFLLRSQRPVLHQWALLRSGSKLRIEARIHHASLSAAERHGRARRPDAKRTIRASSTFRLHPVCNRKRHHNCTGRRPTSGCKTGQDCEPQKSCLQSRFFHFQLVSKEIEIEHLVAPKQQPLTPINDSPRDKLIR